MFAGILAILEFLKKVLDLVTPWSTYWVEKRKKRNQKREDAQKRMGEAAKEGDYDSFLDSRADRDSA